MNNEFIVRIMDDSCENHQDFYLHKEDMNDLKEFLNTTKAIIPKSIWDMLHSIASYLDEV